MISRRSVLRAAAAASIAAPYIARAANSLIPFSSGGLSPGFTNVYLGFIERNRLDEKHGLKMAKPVEYTSLYAFHNDFAVGAFDLALGSWDTFAMRYAGGVPIKLLCGINAADMIGLVVPGAGAKTLQELKGKLLAATQGSGVYRMMRGVLQETAGINTETFLSVQNVDNPALAVTMVMGERADAVLTWEPNISIGIQKRSDLRVLFNVGQAYREKFGLDLPFLGAAMRDDALKRAPDMGQRINAMMEECTDSLWHTPDAITPEIAAKTNVNLEAIEAGIKSNRVRFTFLDLSEPTGRKVFESAAGFLYKHQAFSTPVDPSFFFSS